MEGQLGGGRTEQKGKGLRDTDNSVVIVGGRGTGGRNGNGNTVTEIFKKDPTFCYYVSCGWNTQQAPDLCLVSRRDQSPLSHRRHRYDEQNSSTQR